MNIILKNGLGADEEWPWKKWKTSGWASDEVYILHMKVYNLPATITTAAQVYPLLRAFVNVTPDPKLDIRGITVARQPNGTSTVDIVFTDAGVHLPLKTGWFDAKLNNQMNDWLKQNGSSLFVAFLGSYWSDKPSIVNFWFGRAPLWTYAAYDAQSSKGRDVGLTSAYLNGQGVFDNSYAESPQFEVKPPQSVPLAAPERSGIPGAYPAGGGGYSPSGAQPSRASAAGDLNYVAIGSALAAAAGAYWFLGRKRATPNSRRKARR